MWRWLRDLLFACDWLSGGGGEPEGTALLDESRPPERHYHVRGCNLRFLAKYRPEISTSPCARHPPKIYTGWRAHWAGA